MVDATVILCYDSTNYNKCDDGESTQHQHSTENIPAEGVSLYLQTAERNGARVVEHGS